MEKQMIKLQPACTDSEQAVLGLLMKNRNAFFKYSDKIEKDDFYHDAHKKLYSLLCDYYATNDDHDIVSLCDFLIAKNKTQSDLVGQVLTSSGSESNILRYIDIMRDRHTRRRFIDASNAIHDSALDLTQELLEVSTIAEKSIYESIPRVHDVSRYTLHGLIPEFINELDDKIRNPREIIGLKSGFYCIDSVTQGFRKSNLIVLAARPGVGKTALALNVIKNVVYNQHKVAMFFSIEMSAEEIAKRFFSSMSCIDCKKINSGDLNQSEQSRVFECVAKIAEHGSNLIINDSSDLTPTKLRTEIRRQSIVKKPDFICVDYLQLMSVEKKLYNKTEEITEISRELKKIAKEFNVPVFALSQLNRAIETRFQKKPQLSDLRGSGSIEQDADIVMIMHKDESVSDQNIISIDIAKNRHGEIKEIGLEYTGNTFTFSNKEAYPASEYVNVKQSNLKQVNVKNEWAPYGD